MGVASTLPPADRWWQIAESTPVSSVIRASTWTWLPRRPAFTSEICGGLVSSARAASAQQKTAKAAKRKGRMRRDYLTSAASDQSGRRGRPLRRQLHGDDLRNARLLHGDAIQRVGHLHR